MKLNIGCGHDWIKYPGYEGVDISDFGQKYILDFAKDGLQSISDNSVQEIMCWYVLEHIPMDRVIFCMNELNRVLVMGGKVHIKVPMFPHEISVSDPTHASFWTIKRFTQYFAGKSPRNTTYYDHLGHKMAKWGICNDGKGNYILEIIQERAIDIWMYKR